MAEPKGRPIFMFFTVAGINKNVLTFLNTGCSDAVVRAAIPGVESPLTIGCQARPLYQPTHVVPSVLNQTILACVVDHWCPCDRAVKYPWCGDDNSKECILVVAIVAPTSHIRASPCDAESCAAQLW